MTHHESTGAFGLSITSGQYTDKTTLSNSRLWPQYHISGQYTDETTVGFGLNTTCVQYTDERTVAFGLTTSVVSMLTNLQ